MVICRDLLLFKVLTIHDCEGSAIDGRFLLTSTPPSVMFREHHGKEGRKNIIQRCSEIHSGCGTVVAPMTSQQMWLHT